MVNKETISKFISWTNIVGIFSIVMGALSALAGIFALVVGAIPGVIMIIMGVKLLNAKKAAQELLAVEDITTAIPVFDQLLAETTTYFKIQGILYIVSIVISIIGMIVGFGMMAAMINSYSGF